MYQYANGRIAVHLLSRNSFITDPELLSICLTLIPLKQTQAEEQILSG